MGTIQFISTRAGTSFARRIGKELNEIGHHYFLSNILNCEQVYLDKVRDNYLIHPRVAYPFPQYSKFMTFLFSIYRKVLIVNTPDALALTSNKYKCNYVMEKSGLNVPHATLLEQSSREVYGQFHDGNFIIKPVISNGGGRTVHVFKSNNDYENFLRGFAHNGGAKKCFVQPFLDVAVLWRIILVNGKAYRYSFFDTPELANGNWKLSVCINRDMAFENIDNTPEEVVNLAVLAQNVVHGTVNFIDVFETRDREFYISEINTSCNLRLHEIISESNIARFIAEGLVKYAGW